MIFNGGSTGETKNSVKFSEHIAKHLSLTGKGKFKWNGSFENLEIFMNELLETQTKWSTPGGHSKLFESDNIIVRWY